MGGRRVLIVDDDPELGRLLETVLTDEGFEAFVALDGADATRSATALRPDLILLDIHVPSAELAFRFARDHRARGTGAAAPIVVMSGDAEIESIGREVGASGLLRKPFGIAEIVTMVRAQLGEPDGAGSALTEPGIA